MASFRTKPPKGALLNRADPLAVGLAGALLLNEGAGPTVYDAVAGKRGNGTLVNGPTWGSGPYGRLLAFDGTDDYVDGSLPYTALGSTYTIAVLVRDDALNTRDYISFGAHALININTTSWRWQYDTGGFPFVTATTPTRVVGSWHMYGITSLGTAAGQTLLYYDGAAVGNGAAMSQALTSGNLRLGQQTGLFAGRYLSGAVAGAWAWRTPLAAKAHRDLAADPFRMFRRRSVPVPLKPTAAAAAPVWFGDMTTRPTTPQPKHELIAY